MDCSPPGSSVHGLLQITTGVGCHALFQGIFLTQGLNPSLLCLLHWQAGSLPLVPPGKLHSYHSSCISKLSSLCFIFRWPQPVWPDNKHSFPRLYPIPEAYQRHRKATGGEFCQGPGTKGRSTCIMPSQLIQISSTPRSVLQNNHYQVKQIHFTYICYQN